MQLNAARSTWTGRVEQFSVCQATEKALIAQVVEAVDAIYYLRALLNRTTGQYTTTIATLMTHLFDTYGKVTPQQVKAREIEVTNIIIITQTLIN